MTDTPDAVFAALHKAADAAHGAKLFTVTVMDRAAGLVRRGYTSHPVEYPTTATKQMGGNGSEWSDQVIGRGQPFIANTTPEFARYFADHETITAIGCASAMNIPVMQDGLVVGTVNILDKENHFTPQVAADFVALVETHRPALLAAMANVPMGTAA